MPTIFSHAIAAGAMGSLAPRPLQAVKLFLLGMTCAMVPDADVLSFALGIPYGHWLGHRGFTHSICFALLLGTGITLLFYSRVALFSKKWWILWAYFCLSTASHGLLDALTTGGKGIAFLAPFHNQRYFGPEIWRQIRVSPIGVEAFFSRWGWQVIKSEMLWIWLPSGLVLLLGRWIRK
jgi:inner membrane protein